MNEHTTARYAGAIASLMRPFAPRCRFCQRQDAAMHPDVSAWGNICLGCFCRRYDLGEGDRA